MGTILITNDDGVDAPGLAALREALAGLGTVVCIAPDRDQSGAGHALTLNHPLRIKQIGAGIWSVDGTPTDCVNMGVFHLLDKKPALIVSGINPSHNLGDDITYSGTVSAAFEGTLLGVRSFAISCEAGRGPEPFAQAARVAATVARRVLNEGLPVNTLLNVNVPRSNGQGFRLTRQGRRLYQEGIVERTDPKGRQYYWIGGTPPDWKEDPESDYAAVQAGYVSITPLRFDLTHYEVMEEMAARWES